LKHKAKHNGPSFVRWLSRWFIRRLLNALIDVERAGKQAVFRIPERLQAH